MASKKEMSSLPTEVFRQIDLEVFNEAYLPYLNDIWAYEVYWGGGGGGKCFAKGTKVIMYSGELKAVEDIQAGDLLMGADSTPRRVMGTTNGVGELYSVHQNKGMDYVVNEHHILCLKKSKNCVKTPTRKARYACYPEYAEISVKDYLGMTDRWKKNFLGYRVAIDYPKTNLPIDPYFLGIWLGDGSKDRVEITTEDSEVVSFIYSYAESIGQGVTIFAKKGNATSYFIKGVRGRGSKSNPGVREQMSALGLLYNKHIPYQYLHADREARLQLLAGLIDTDGSLRNNCYEITQKSEVLALDIKMLADSLGLRCSIASCQKTCMNNGVTGTYWRMSISGNTQEIPVRIERKKVVSYNKLIDPMCTGITVTPIGAGEYFGFETDGDHKFLLADGTVTHNSHFIAHKIALQMTGIAGRNLLCLREHKNDCDTSVYPEIYSALQDFDLLQY